MYIRATTVETEPEGVDDSVRNFREETLPRIRALPGFEGATMSERVPSSTLTAQIGRVPRESREAPMGGPALVTEPVSQTGVNFIGPLMFLGMLVLILVLVVRERGHAAATARVPTGRSWNTRSLKIGVVAIVLYLAMVALHRWVETEGPEQPGDLLVLPLQFFVVWGFIQGVVDGLGGMRLKGVRAKALSWCGLLLNLAIVLVMLLGRG
jgi:hypothetical protein